MLGMILGVVSNSPVRCHGEIIETLGGDGHYFMALSKYFEEVWLFLPEAPPDRPLGYELTARNVKVFMLPEFDKEFHGWISCLYIKDSNRLPNVVW
jgi:hypothetical protein